MDPLAPMPGAIPDSTQISPQGSVRVVVYDPSGRVSSHEFEKRCVSIGRSRDADVRLKDPAVSRIHCFLETAAGEVRVVDNGSRNGFEVDGARTAEAFLSLENELTIEGFRLRVGLVRGGTVTERAPMPSKDDVTELR